MYYGNNEYQPIKVTAGMTYELDTSDPSRQQRTASAFKVHPEYKGQPEDNRNDIICLLKLDKLLDVGQAVSPIQLPSQDEEPSLKGCQEESVQFISLELFKLYNIM
jgi:hypothetical protein